MDFEAESTFLSRPAVCGYCLIPRPQRSPALYKLLGDTMVLYCPFRGAQVPHIAEGTVRENIVFGAPFDEVHVFVVIVTSPWWWGVHLAHDHHDLWQARYWKAVAASGLESDLKLLPGQELKVWGPSTFLTEIFELL